MVDIKKIFKGDYVQCNLESKVSKLSKGAWYEVFSINASYDIINISNNVGDSIPLHIHWIKDHESFSGEEDDGWDIPIGAGNELNVKKILREIDDFPSAYDSQEGGSHYQEQGIQPKAYIKANNLNFDQGNVVKYVTRFRTKNGAEDLKKVIHYARFLLEDEYNIRSKVEYNG